MDHIGQNVTIALQSLASIPQKGNAVCFDVGRRGDEVRVHLAFTLQNVSVLVGKLQHAFATDDLYEGAQTIVNGTKAAAWAAVEPMISGSAFSECGVIEAPEDALAWISRHAQDQMRIRDCALDEAAMPSRQEINSQDEAFNVAAAVREWRLLEEYGVSSFDGLIEFEDAQRLTEELPQVTLGKHFSAAPIRVPRREEKKTFLSAHLLCCLQCDFLEKLLVASDIFRTVGE